MTRKDYVAIAEAFADSRPSAVTTPVQFYQWEDTRNKVANVFAEDNPRFDRQRFYKACEGDK